MYANSLDDFSTLSNAAKSYWILCLFAVALVRVWPGSPAIDRQRGYSYARGRANGSNRMITPEAYDESAVKHDERRYIQLDRNRSNPLVSPTRPTRSYYRYRSARKHRRRAVRYECIRIFILCRKQTVLDSKFFETVWMKRPKQLVESAINIGGFFFTSPLQTKKQTISRITQHARSCIATCY